MYAVDWLRNGGEKYYRLFFTGSNGELYIRCRGYNIISIMLPAVGFPVKDGRAPVVYCNDDRQVCAWMCVCVYRQDWLTHR